jgi:hypothetical protein
MKRWRWVRYEMSTSRKKERKQEMNMNKYEYALPMQTSGTWFNQWIKSARGYGSVI